MAGACSGTFSTLLLQPLDLIKTRMQLSQTYGTWSSKPGCFATAVAIVRYEGVKQLWRGTSVSLLRAVPGVALYFTSLQSLQVLFSPMFTSNQPSWAQGLLLGGTARSFVGITLLPLTVLKVNYEAERRLLASVRLRGFLKSVTHNGALWRGLIPTLLRDTPYSALYYAFYSQFRKIILPTVSNCFLFCQSVPYLTQSVLYLFAIFSSYLL